MKNKILLFIGVIISLLGIAFVFYFNKFYTPRIEVNNIVFNNDVVNVYLDTYSIYKTKIRCAIVKDDVDNNSSNIKWNNLNYGVCSEKISKGNNYKILVKSQDKIIEIDGSTILDVTFKKHYYYMAIGESIKLDYKSTGISKPTIVLKSDNDYASVDKNTITAKKKGKSIITVDGLESKEKVNILVTDLINKAPKEYNYDRDYLKCNAFTEKEAKLLDKILADRVKTKGLGTRAGVVEAARFLTLNFPYRIKYFSENGRMHGYNYVDGEGRYYHKGLYLSYDKTNDIEYTDKGPNPWGCTIFSKPSKGYRANGLDCSGFTTWVLYNGGFDVGDLPAKGTGGGYDNLNQYGEEVFLNSENSASKDIKAGDLLGEVTVSEGHSAIIIGVDDNYYYVAESLWISPLGVNVNKYKKEDLYKSFETVNLMDSYYKDDGNYTSMWY